MYNLRRFRTPLTKNRSIKESYINQMLTREPVNKINRLHPRAKIIYNKMIEKPKPLSFKLQELDEKNFLCVKPLGNTESLPFQVDRTHTDNLPVYTEYKAGRSQTFTIIRRVTGDIETLKNEVAKVVSNSEVHHSIGKIMVKGAHSYKIKFWLARLGF